ncbi:hypothetical protein D3C72_1796380 [compost metagenome]
MVCGAVGVAVNERMRLGRLQPGDGGRAVYIGIGDARLFACLALLADATRLRATRGQGLGQKLRLPRFAARLHAKPLVVHIVQAQQIAVAEQEALVAKPKHRGV